MTTGTEAARPGAELSLAARALLERRRGAGTNGAPAAAIGRRPSGSGPTPLSLAQQRLWFLEQLDPGGAVYNVPLAIRLRGKLDVPALERALAEVVRRHEALRTTVGEADGGPVQIVAAAAGLALPLVRLKEKHDDAAAETREAYLRLRMLEEARRPFDVARGPLVRAVLHRVDRRDHLLLVTMHHLVADGWSTGVLGRELAALYGAFVDGKPSPLPEPPIQYADYATWQRARLAGEEGGRQLAYWERRLADLDPLDLPTDYPRPAIPGRRAGRHAVTLPRSLADAFGELGRREGATLFMTLLAAFQAVLARHSGQEDIAVGTPIAGRTRTETEGLIGFFVNTLVLRTDLGGNPTFRELVARARATAHGAYAHQEVPFERLVEALRPGRDLGRTPLFRVFLNMRNLADVPFAFAGLKAERLPSPAEGAKFDLSLEVAERPEGLRLELVFDAELFAAGTVERIGRHLRELVAVVTADPERRLAAIPLVAADARAAAPGGGLVRPDAAFVRFPPAAVEQAIGRRFAERVAAAPDAPAIRSVRHAWSYAELDRAANRVAHAVRERVGGGAGRVALLCDHGAPMVAAMLGVLKSGHAYVPLDPHHPPDRLAVVLAEAEVGGLVADDVHAAAAHALVGRGTPVIAAAVAGREDEPDPDVPPDAPAYLLYTSGSTGRPKGVVQNHRNVLHHVRAYTNALGIGAGDRLTLLAPYGTDAAAMDIFGALLNGACLHPLDLRAEGPERIGPWLTEQGISLYHSTPTVFRAFLDTLAEERFPGVRAVVLGGEAAVPWDVERFRDRFPPDAVFVNGLGPTESTTALQRFVGRESLLAGRTVPVGFPVEETEVLLLDRGGNAIAGHGVGEIAIRSAHVALGYWRRPELTAAAFADDGGDDGGKRTYRTGDLGRTLADGGLEHVGRKDLQVKIRGFRVEPGEVEEALRPHPAVRDVAVVAREDTPGETRLVAYVVPAAGPPDREARSPDDLRRYLRAKLPGPMVPAAIVLLDGLPLTASGKLDRRALPVPEAVRGEPESAPVAPRTRIEEAVAAVWRQVLGVDRIGVDDHFFDLGGHSLLVAQVVARLRETLGVDLPVRALFEAPTVAALAERAEAAGRGEGGAATASAALVPLQPEGAERPVFLVPGGAGDAINLFKMTKLARTMGQDRPFYGFFAEDVDAAENEAPQAWTESVAAAYLAEVRTRQPEGPYILGGTCLGGVIAFEMAQQLVARGEEVLRLFLFDAWRPGARRGFDPGDQGRRHERMGRRPRRSVADGVTGTAEAGPLGRGGGRQRPPGPTDDRLAARRWRLQRYQPRPYPGRVVLFVNREWHGENPTLGWDVLTPGGLDVLPMPGSHGTNLADNLELTVERLRACLAEL